jgi:hypothetical protein
MYLEQERAKPETDIFGTLNKKLAEQCLQLIDVDQDGSRFLNYLGAGFPAIQGTLGREMVKKAYRFVAQQSQNCKSDAKLAPRYARLKDYFERRLRGEAWMTFEDSPQSGA